MGVEKARRKGCERVWHNLLKKATSERAPWGTIPYRCEHDDVKFRKDIGKAYPKTELFYKLNMSVDELNCRRKLVRNCNGTQYESSAKDENVSERKFEEALEDQLSVGIKADLWQELMTYYNNEVDDDNDIANEEEMRNLSDTASWGHMGSEDPYTGRSTSKNRENSFSLEEEIVAKDDTNPTTSATNKGMSKANFNCDISYIEHMNVFPSKLSVTESVIRISIKNEKEAGNHSISNKRIQEDEKYGVSLRPHAVQEWSLKLIKGITKRRYECVTRR